MRNKSWPFKNLDIGQSCTIPAQDAAKARAYVYVYGSQRRKRFSCEMQPSGDLVVTRKDWAVEEVVLTLEKFEALVNAFQTKERLREAAQMLTGPFKVEHRGEEVALIRTRAD